MQNVDIRIAIAESGLKHWEVAKKIGIDNTSFSRLLRYELDSEKKQRVMNAIGELKKEKGNANN